MDYKSTYENNRRYILLNDIQTTRFSVMSEKTGGSSGDKMIIHICGPSGSGKTTLGSKLKEEFNEKIIVKDIDDLRHEFIKSHYGDTKWKIIDKNAYQRYINKYISEQNKPIIFVGLNHMPWWHKNYYYDMHSSRNYYIEIDDATIIKQKCLRLFKEFSNELVNDEVAMNDLINNNKRFLKNIKQTIDAECDKNDIVKMNKKWNKYYKKQGYKYMSREDIFKEVSIILNKIFGIKKN